MIRGPYRPRPARSRFATGVQIVIALCAVLRLVLMLEDRVEKQNPARAVGNIKACPVRIAAMVPIGSAESRGTDAAAFAIVLADALDEPRVSGSLWINASGHPYHVAFADRQALANDLSGRPDPIVVAMPARVRLEEAFVDTYGDGPAVRPCAIAGDWTGAMTPALHADMLARIGAPSVAGALAAQRIHQARAACQNRNAFGQTIDDSPPDVPLEARRKNLTGDVDVLLHLDAASVVTSTGILASPNAILNAAARDAARASLFRTEIRHCRPVASNFVFVVSYLSDGR